MLRSLREALAQYALGDEEAGPEQIVAPLEEQVGALVEAIEAEVFILDRLYELLPRPPYSEEETETLARNVLDYVRERSRSGVPLGAPVAA